ncbi:MAG TPA: IclR family transcriptional regulator C-terminal domain-containing protein [Trebonia sp.]|jgi:DNA-binding IclR family transcriptional regulator|nr:IclR family transcriptional regulator C-terminal domain-containing protein [Trebonia sp.]
MVFTSFSSPRKGLARITPYTITRPEQLSHQLRRVRRYGCAHTSEEMSLGAC